MSLMQILFGFNGRIRRSQYWLASLAFGVVICVIYFGLFSMMGASYDPYTGATSLSGTASIAGILMIVLYIPIIWVSLAIQVKRWHDRDKSGWWVLISFVPFIGGIWALVECGFLDGTQGPNKYGPSPKGIGGTADLVRTFS